MVTNGMHRGTHNRAVVAATVGTTDGKGVGRVGGKRRLTAAREQCGCAPW